MLKLEHGKKRTRFGKENVPLHINPTDMKDKRNQGATPYASPKPSKIPEQYHTWSGLFIMKEPKPDNETSVEAVVQPCQEL